MRVPCPIYRMDVSYTAMISHRCTFTWNQRTQLFGNLRHLCAVYYLVVEVRFLVGRVVAPSPRLAHHFGGDLQFKAILLKSNFFQHHMHLTV